MATFTVSTSWTVNIDGRAKTYSYEYDVDDVIDVQRVAADDHILQNVLLDQEPVLIAYVNKHASILGSLSLVESAGPTSVDAGFFQSGETFILSVSDAGGTWNSSGVDNTATLRTLDQIAVGGSGNRNGNFDLLILHQAAS